MKLLFPALVNRYAVYPELVRIGRKLVRGVDQPNPNYPRPCVVVTGTQDTTEFSTFRQEIERWTIEFRLMGKHLKETDADIWHRQMRLAFHRGILLSAEFDLIAMRIVTTEGPTVPDGNDSWDALATMDVMIGLLPVEV